ncbi:HlyD family secretion protein [Thalassotalea crassostreae]|uniref:HlyD family secretion protein n=1 Tax=Thalassotalea crassostreae TaxID=1763536 RepID=UPI00083831A5|nr:HlyD family efflux transporter periplasmic adaptor subunit [Thalassotalea crassostreae]
MSLFRKQVLQSQSQRLPGAVSLSQPFSLKLCVLVTLSIFIFIITFLSVSNYSRKATVRGFLNPDKGLIKVFSPQLGIIGQLHVDNGEQVKRGQALATIVNPNSTILDSEQSSDLNAQLITQLEAKYQLVTFEQENLEQLKTTTLNKLKTREQYLKQQQQALVKQQHVLEQKKVLVDQQNLQFEKLYQQGHVSERDQKQQKQLLLEIKQEQLVLQRLMLNHKNEQAEIQYQWQVLPQQYLSKINALEGDKSEIKNRLMQLKNQQRYTVTASTSGQITSVQVVAGEAIDSSKPLMHILPSGAKLVATLLVPSRAVGFIQKGDIARLRFDAFPYQKFGMINSDIESIDQSIMLPNEVALPIALQEPSYQIKATLNEQYVSAYGQSFALRSGMLFEADVELEKRAVFEWLLEPLISLKGKIN